MAMVLGTLCSSVEQNWKYKETSCVKTYDYAKRKNIKETRI